MGKKDTLFYPNISIKIWIFFSLKESSCICYVRRSSKESFGSNERKELSYGVGRESNDGIGWVSLIS
jgi:hypothetical protein